MSEVQKPERSPFYLSDLPNEDHEPGCPCPVCVFERREIAYLDARDRSRGA